MRDIFRTGQHVLNPGQLSSDQKKLLRGGNVPTTSFLGLQMREKAKTYERMNDTTKKSWLEMLSKHE
jgi:hypothetical protein